MPKVKITGSGITRWQHTSLSSKNRPDRKRLLARLNAIVQMGDPVDATMNELEIIARNILAAKSLPADASKLYVKTKVGWAEGPLGGSLTAIMDAEGIVDDSAEGYSFRILNLIHIARRKIADPV